MFLLCDLQGGVYADCAILTDPILMSMTRSYGPTDLGKEGITTFFARHVCGRYCRAHWQRPKSKAVFFPECQGSQMEDDIVPTRTSRRMSSMARVKEEDDEDNY